MLRNTYSTDDLMERLSLMRVFYSRRLFSGGEGLSLRVVLKDECLMSTLTALEEWQDAFRSSDISPLVVYEALDTIEEDLSGIPSVLLYVPIHFTQDHVIRFGQWFRENVQPNILLTLRTDPSVSGGCGFVWNDIFYDFSIRYHVQKHREEVVTMFNTYSHA